MTFSTYPLLSVLMDQLKQALGSYMSLWLCFLFWLTSSLSLDEHVLASRSCLSVCLCTWLAAWCAHQRGATEDSALVDRSQLFFLVQRTDSKSWLVPHRHITLFSASWLYSLHYIIHCKKKENLCQKMIVSLFLSISVWK